MIKRLKPAVFIACLLPFAWLVYHAVTNALLRALFADDSAWRWVVCDAQVAARLPGVGVTKADLYAVA